ncbi:hypothetical protein [Allosphingosinicella sp.]|uniref:hypothetical protein n=1 Tax=Allosphingosinicella sp. TaxID=2823234 RepID=UPI003784A8DF
MRNSLIALLALSAAACSGGQAPSANAANAVEPVGNQVAALSEGQRDAVFIRAIRDAGLECQRVQGSVRMGEYRGMPVWHARCQGGGEWLIVVANDGTAQILNPAEAQSVRPPISNSH